MLKRVRIYGRTLDRWSSEDETCRRFITQIEVEYKDYEFDFWGTGEWDLVGTGTEDFSPERYKTCVSECFVWTWDGRKLNKGGHRCFEEQGLIKFNSSDRKNVIDYLKLKYNNAELIQLRKFQYTSCPIGNTGRKERYEDFQRALRNERRGT